MPSLKEFRAMSREDRFALIDQHKATTVDDDEGEEEPDLYTCPWCMKDNQTTEQIRECSGFKSSRMPANETGHYYGCGCPDCRDEYRRLK